MPMKAVPEKTGKTEKEANMRIPGFTAEVTIGDKAKYGWVAQARPYGDDGGVVPQIVGIIGNNFCVCFDDWCNCRPFSPIFGPVTTTK